MKALKKKSLLFELFILLVVAFCIVFFKFNQIPLNLAYDEVELAKLALSLKGQGYVPYSTLADGHGTPYFYLMLVFFKVFGVSSFAMRLPVAIMSILSPLITYSIFRMVFHKKTETALAFIAVLFLITTRWYFNFARFAFEMPFLLYIELIGIYAFFQFKKNGRLVFLIVCAFFSGLAYNSYQPGRIFFILPFLFLLSEKNIRQIVVFIVVFLIVIAPMTSYLITHKGNDIRFNQQFFLKNSELTFQKKTAFLTDNIVKLSLMFNIRGDVSGRHNYPNKPALNPVTGLLFIIGLGLAVIGLGKFYNQFFLLYFVLAIIPAVLTYPWENPNMLRTYTSLIPITYFICNSLVFFLKSLYKRVKPIYIYSLIIFLLLLSAVYDLRTYFVFQAPIFKNAFERENDLQVDIDADQRNKSARPNR